MFNVKDGGKDMEVQVVHGLSGLIQGRMGALNLHRD